MAGHVYWGIDGCKGGWIAIGLTQSREYIIAQPPDIATFWENHGESAKLVLVDMPIGLASDAGGRQTEDAARAVLEHRRSSVFGVPTREAIAYGGQHGFSRETYQAACDINREIEGKAFSLQSWNISAKIHEIDLFLREDTRRKHVLVESHPEVIFWALNDQTPMQYSKKSGLGFMERLHCLERYQPNALAIIREAYDQYQSVLLDDDIVDALACAICARMPHLQTLPGDPKVDTCGLPMQMIYPGTRSIR